MNSWLRWGGALAFAVSLAVTAVVSAAPPARSQPQPTVALPAIVAALGDPANIDPLVSPNPFLIISDSVGTLPLLFNVPLSSGAVSISVTCCTDANTGQSASPRGFDLSISPGQGRVDATHHGTATLTAKTSNTPTGAFLSTVHIVSMNTARHVATGGSILVNVVKVPVDDRPTCSRLAPSNGTAVEVLPLNTVVSTLFGAKLAAPARTSFTIGAATVDQKNGVLMTIEKGTLKPSISTVVLKNSTPDDKQVIALDASCNPIGPAQIVQSGHTASQNLFANSTTTLLLQRLVCRSWFFVCWSWGWDDVAVFSPMPFWTLFGGRQVTLDWKVSQGDR